MLKYFPRAKLKKSTNMKEQKSLEIINQKKMCKVINNPLILKSKKYNPLILKSIKKIKKCLQKNNNS